MLQLVPEYDTVYWFVDFSASPVIVNVTTEVVTTSTTEGNVTTETTVEPISTSVFISSVVPVEAFPPEPTVTVNITSTTSFEISGVYKNMMGTVHVWRDNSYALQTSIVPPAPGTYDKIIQVISPPLQPSPGKPWLYSVNLENDQNVTRTTSTVDTSLLETISVNTVTTGTPVLTGTSILSISTSTSSSSIYTTTTTVISKITTSTQTIPDWLQITRRVFTSTETLTVASFKSLEHAVSALTFTMYVIHNNYDIVKNNILIPLLNGQPEPLE